MILEAPNRLESYNNLGLTLNGNIRTTGQHYWLVSPYYFMNYGAIGSAVESNGNFGTERVNLVNGVRPSISLVPGIEYSSGDGSMANPYVVKTD